MKAVLKFCLGTRNVDLEIMDLYAMDQYLMQHFNDSEDLRGNNKYFSKINEVINEHPNPENLKQSNGSIRLFLQNDDGTPILEKTNYSEGELVQKQIRVLYKKDALYYSPMHMKSYLILQYQENPTALRNIMKKICIKLKREYNNDKQLNNFMNYYSLLDVEKEMFNDTRSLFTSKNIEIKNKKKYDQKVIDFVRQMRFSNMGELYLDVREDAARQVDKLGLKTKKILKCDEPVGEVDLDDLLRRQLFKNNPNIDAFHQNLIMDDYKRLQKENKEYERIEQEGTRYRR